MTCSILFNISKSKVLRKFILIWTRPDFDSSMDIYVSIDIVRWMTLRSKCTVGVLSSDSSYTVYTHTIQYTWHKYLLYLFYPSIHSEEEFFLLLSFVQKISLQSRKRKTISNLIKTWEWIEREKKVKYVSTFQLTSFSSLLISWP